MKSAPSSTIGKLYRWNQTTLLLMLGGFYLYALGTCLLNRQYLFESISEKLVGSVTMTVISVVRFFPLWGSLGVVIGALDYAAMHTNTLSRNRAKRVELLVGIVTPLILLAFGAGWEPVILYAVVVPLCGGIVAKFQCLPEHS